MIIGKHHLLWILAVQEEYSQDKLKKKKERERILFYFLRGSLHD